ncbi:hypothetical protein [Paenibacillus sp. RC67]|nr:hypothetical protein [Paenibacillus sp. RC67]
MVLWVRKRLRPTNVLSCNASALKKIQLVSIKRPLQINLHSKYLFTGVG